MMVNKAGHKAENISRPLKITLIIISAVLVVELVGGILSNSLSLLGDAGHMLVDVLALSMSLLAIRIAKRPPTLTKTFGYHRVEIMAALANGVILVLVAAYIFYQAYQRFQDPPEVQTNLMLIVAVVGLAANLIGLRLLRKARHASLNVKAAFWHVLGDTISSVGVIVGAIIISITGWKVVDPIIAIVIGGIILWGAVRLVRESADILLEAVPKHVKVAEVIGLMKAVSGVEEVHDVHVWTITSGIYALSAHLIIEDQAVSKSAEILKAVNDGLAEKFNISHTTLQIECDTCPSGTVCGLSQPEDRH